MVGKIWLGRGKIKEKRSVLSREDLTLNEQNKGETVGDIARRSEGKEQNKGERKRNLERGNPQGFRGHFQCITFCFHCVLAGYDILFQILKA